MSQYILVAATAKGSRGVRPQILYPAMKNPQSTAELFCSDRRVDFVLSLPLFNNNK